jgi:hypothetical protein
VRLTTKTTVGIRTGCFSSTLLFLKDVLKLEIAHDDQEKEFVQFKLPSGEMLEVFGSKNLWHCFTTTPDWEVILADVRYRKEKIAGGADAAGVTVTDHANRQRAQNDSA